MVNCKKSSNFEDSKFFISSRIMYKERCHTMEIVMNFLFLFYRFPLYTFERKITVYLKHHFIFQVDILNAKVM